MRWLCFFDDATLRFMLLVAFVAAVRLNARHFACRMRQPIATRAAIHNFSTVAIVRARVRLLREKGREGADIYNAGAGASQCLRLFLCFGGGVHQNRALRALMRPAARETGDCAPARTRVEPRHAARLRGTLERRCHPVSCLHACMVPLCPANTCSRIPMLKRQQTSIAFCTRVRCVGNTVQLWSFRVRRHLHLQVLGVGRVS